MILPRFNLLKLKRRVYHQRFNYFSVFKVFLFIFIICLFVYILIQIITAPSKIKILILDHEYQNKIIEASVSNYEDIWNIQEFKYYKNLESLKAYHNHLNITKPVSKSGPVGLWLLTHYSHQKYAGGIKNFIGLSQFQYSDEFREVSIGLRLYIYNGNGKKKNNQQQRRSFLLVKLRDGLTSATYTLKISSSSNNNNKDGFCNKIIPLRPSDFIDEIEISGEIMEEDSYILINKIVVIVAEVGTSRSFLYSLMPNQWCDSEYY